jgi:glycosyltransferase involved in cell wall biosynthesis
VADRQTGRILVVAPQPFYQDRGTPIALRQVLEALSGLGYQVDVLTYPVGEDIELPGLRIFRAGNPFGIGRVPVGLSVRKVLLDLSLTAALRSRLRQERYTCVHALEEAAFPAAVLSRQHRIPLLYDMHSSLPEQLFQHAVFRLPPIPWILEAAERWLLRRSDLVVSSAGLADRVRRIVPASEVREWRFSGAAADPDAEEASALRRRLGLGPEQRVVLYSGTFEDYQGLDELIAGIPAVVAEVPGAVFVLVGAEADTTLAADGAAAPLVASGALRIIRRQPRPAMPAYHAMADVLVSPRSYGGNLPLKVFDYLAAGRPIVATDLPTHRTVLSEERAVLVQPTTEAIAQGILAVLRDPERAVRLADAARRYAEEHLAWNAWVRWVGQLYEDLHRHAPRG